MRTTIDNISSASFLLLLALLLPNSSIADPPATTRYPVFTSGSNTLGGVYNVSGSGAALMVNGSNVMTGTMAAYAAVSGSAAVAGSVPGGTSTTSLAAISGSGSATLSGSNAVGSFTLVCGTTSYTFCVSGTGATSIMTLPGNLVLAGAATMNELIPPGNITGSVGSPTDYYSASYFWNISFESALSVNDSLALNAFGGGDIDVGAGGVINFHPDTNVFAVPADVGLTRSGAGVLQVTNGSSGSGTILTGIPTADPSIAHAPFDRGDGTAHISGYSYPVIGGTCPASSSPTTPVGWNYIISGTNILGKTAIYSNP